MAFSLPCEKKGCGKTIEPVIDKQTNKVYCTCDEEHEIKQLTDFAKRQLIGMNQVKTKQRQQKAFAVKCESCEREGTPLLKTGIRDDKGRLQADQLICTFCKKELTNISQPFVQVLKENLKAQKRATQK